VPVDSEQQQSAVFSADPLADDTMARIIGAWNRQSVALNPSQFARIGEVNRLLSTWVCNGDLLAWPRPEIAQTADPEIVATLQDFLRAGVGLPDWADRAAITRAEKVFFENGPISCAILFCASLPECYVLPDLADVLHAAGQLEQHTDYRVRSTAAMIFPVMMEGGLTAPEGLGIAQILKVRLIHATIRNLILRGPPTPECAPLPALSEAHNTIFARLFAHGWDVSSQGLPCNQNELAYTLLTFSYVFARALRSLGAALAETDERAILHTWNVVGHVLGIEHSHMVTTMEQAKLAFVRYQAQAAQRVRQPDVRPLLGKALLDTMQANLPIPVVRDLPAYLTLSLCGPTTARTVGADERIPGFAKCVLAVSAWMITGFDWLIRFVVPRFSFTKLIVRAFGLHTVERILLSESRPLRLPNHILHQIKITHSRWKN
jgi:hypothetical protein